MSISAVEIEIPLAKSVKVTADTLQVDLSDGRTISVPVGWYPRLVHATAEAGVSITAHPSSSPTGATAVDGAAVALTV